MKGYEGKIGNKGTAIVKAPFANNGSNKGTTKITGNDLRNKGGSKKNR